MPKKAIVVGAGIAGLATAIRLTAKSYDVTVFESNAYPGGKLHAKTIHGYRFDLGPSLFTMPWLVTELFALHGKDASHYFKYTRKDTICNYFWEDGTFFSLAADSQTFVAEASDFFNENDKSLRKYLNENREKYERTRTLFLEKSLHKLNTYLSLDTLKALLRIPSLGITNSLDAHNSKAFKNEKLVQLFNRYATYNGSSPYKTPGIMSMIPHLEMELGTYFPKGGMHSITTSLYGLARDIGVQFKFKHPVDSIIVKNKKAVGIRCAGKDNLAQVVVSNMDVYPTYKKLLPKQQHPKKKLEQERSSSALIFYWGMAKTFPQLDLHNIFFSSDYKTEFDFLFAKKNIYPDPTVYVNISSKENRSDAPEGHENWFVMINAPANYGQNWEELKTKAKAAVLNKLSSILQTDIAAHITTEFTLDPIGIEENTSSYRGALYGASSNSKFSAFLRHPNFSQKIKNLYFCGGSVHPGGGIPLCLLSAKIVSDLIPKPRMT